MLRGKMGTLVNEWKLSMNPSKIIYIALIGLLIVGCTSQGDLPWGLNLAPRPLVLVAKNESGIIIKDGDGKLYSYNETYYFSQIIMESDMKPGTMIVDKVSD